MLIKYSGENKFIFIANTKCASTSIEASKIAKIADIRITDNNIKKHMPIREIHNRFDFIFEKYDFNDFFKFGIIRDPIDWVVSWFNFRSRVGLKNPNHPNHKNYTGNMTFSEFWHANKDKGFLSPQYHNFFFANKNKNLGVNYLVRQESFIEDIEPIKEILQLDSLGINKKNKSTIKRISCEDVDNKIKEEIYNRYSIDFKLISNLKELNLKGLDRFQTKLPLK